VLSANNWPNIIQQWLYPPTCLLCENPGYRHYDLCFDCHDALPFNNNACPCCGLSLPPHNTEQLCGQCLAKHPSFDSTLALLSYQEPVRHLVRSLKYKSNYASARLLGSLIADKLSTRTDLPQLIIPVPLHPSRYRERGFNQAIEIARPISKALKIPLGLNQCVRIRKTTAQSELPARQRAKNIKRAFEVRMKIPANHIAILDDVVTTSATVAELAKTIRASGVLKIEVWACARA